MFVLSVRLEMVILQRKEYLNANCVVDGSANRNELVIAAFTCFRT